MKNTIKPNFTTKGFLATFLLLLTLALPACIEDPDNPTPRSEVPAAIARKWMAGQFSMGEFWKYDGTYVGNAFELGLAFDFKPNGDCQFYLVTGGAAGGCRTEAFVYKKGTVQFNNDQSFTFYPTEGRTRGYYKGCASSYKNYDQKTDKEDLKPETYFYTLQSESNGQNKLVLRFQQNGTSSTTFRPVNW